MMRKSGMEVVDQIDRAPFVATLQPAMQEYDRMFGHDTIARLRA